MLACMHIHTDTYTKGEEGKGERERGRGRKRKREEERRDFLKIKMSSFSKSLFLKAGSLNHMCLRIGSSKD